MCTLKNPMTFYDNHVKFYTYFGGRMSFPSMASIQLILNNYCNRTKMQQTPWRHWTTMFHYNFRSQNYGENSQVQVYVKCWDYYHPKMLYPRKVSALFLGKFQQTSPLSKKKTTQNLVLTGAKRWHGRLANERIKDVSALIPDREGCWNELLLMGKSPAI